MIIINLPITPELGVNWPIEMVQITINSCHGLKGFVWFLLQKAYNKSYMQCWWCSLARFSKICVPTQGSETTIFPCERWLAKSEDDGETVRELVPSDIITEKLLRDGTLRTTETEVDDALESMSSFLDNLSEMYILVPESVWTR